MEVPGVTAAYYILYNQDHVCPEHFQTLYLGAFITRLKALEAVQTGSTAVPEGYETTTLSKDGDGNIGERNQVDDYLCRFSLRSSLGNSLALPLRVSILHVKKDISSGRT